MKRNHKEIVTAHFPLLMAIIRFIWSVNRGEDAHSFEYRAHRHGISI
jgi:hypothetical protein